MKRRDYLFVLPFIEAFTVYGKQQIAYFTLTRVHFVEKQMIELGVVDPSLFSLLFFQRRRRVWKMHHRNVDQILKRKKEVGREK